MGRRGGERRRGGEGAGIDRRAALGVRGTREVQSAAVADAETAIYLEILWVTLFTCYIKLALYYRFILLQMVIRMLM